MKLLRHRRTIEQRERLRGRDRCQSRHPIWGCVRCDRRDDDHVIHQADDGTFEWLQFMPIKASPSSLV